MEKCPNQEEIDHHVQTGILIEHIDTSYLFKDKGIRKSIKKFAEAHGQAKTPNKFWVSKSSPAFLASVILSVARAIVDDSRERVWYLRHISEMQKTPETSASLVYPSVRGFHLVSSVQYMSSIPSPR